MNQEKKIRILIAKPGLDGHERGAHVVAYGLRDAGFEVIYTGVRQTTEQIVKTAIQEDVNVVGLSILSGAHLSLTQKIMNGLKANNAEDILVIVGGIVPNEDIAPLKEMGVSEIFTSGTPVSAISEFIESTVSDA